MMFIVYFAFFVLIKLHTARSSSATEPVCSKFSYEEKLLEKMIRTEIKVETTQNEIKKTEETVLNTLVEIKKTALDIQDKFEGFGNDHMKEMQSKEEQFANQFEEFTNNITVKMDNERDILAQFKEQISNQFKELTNNITAKMEKERDILAKLKESVLQPSIAFHVHNVKDLDLNTRHEVLVFQSIITNEGSGYDKSTGIFTSPVEGAYFFIVHVCTASGKYSPIGLVLDSTFVARSINYDTGFYTCSSVSAIVRMKSGGRVWVASTAGSSDYGLDTNRLHIMNTFSGMLIST